MGAERWISEPRLTNPQFRLLVAVDNWNRSNPDGRPTNEQIAAMCGWLHDGQPSTGLARRTLRELERDGWLIRGTSKRGGGVKSRIVIATDGGSRPACPAVAEAGPFKDEPSTDERCDSMQHHNAASKDELADAFDYDSLSKPITADALLARVMGLMECVHAEADTLDLGRLEAYASRLDLILGFVPGESFGRDYTALNRFKLYLRFFEAIANGLGLEYVQGKLSVTMARFLRRYDVDRLDFERPYFLRVLREHGINPTAFCQRQKRLAVKNESVKFRQILPDMHHYVMPSHILAKDSKIGR